MDASSIKKETLKHPVLLQILIVPLMSVNKDEANKELSDIFKTKCEDISEEMNVSKEISRHKNCVESEQNSVWASILFIIDTNYILLGKPLRSNKANRQLWFYSQSNVSK